MKNNFLKLCAFASILYPVVTHCEIFEDMYCFDSGEAGAKDFSLYALYDDITKWSGAFVKYRRENLTITLVLKSYESEAIAPDRPYQATTTWYEVYNGKITGEYEMMSQGAYINSMTYVNYKTHKKMAFLFNSIASEENEKRCKW